MKINGMHHIAVNTVDIETSIAFYENVLGFEVCDKADMGMLELVYLKAGENQFMELFDLRGNVIEGSVDESQQGLRHIAFDVTDIGAWNQRLKEMDVEFVGELSTLDPIGKNCLLILDPNGVVIELCEDAK